MLRANGWRSFALLCLLALFGCSSTRPPDPRYEPSRNLLEIVGDFHRFFKEDGYRFAAPKDLAGINVYKATVARLGDYEQKYPGRSSEIVYFTKAQALERLREYEKAASYYQKVADAGARLKEEAEKNLAILKAFIEIHNQPITSTTYLEYVRQMDKKAALWNKFIQDHAGTPYEYLAREEEERLDRAKVVFVEVNRFHLENGAQMVNSAFQQLLAKHQESKNYDRYVLDLADFYARLAHETVLQNDPQALGFPLEDFTRLVNEGLKLYSLVANKEGVEERMEAVGKLQALSSFQKQIRALNQ